MKYIMDTDPGIDDAIAIMMGYLNGLDIIGFTLAQGNIELKHSENNIKVIEDILESDINIYKGKHVKEMDYEVASYAHGENGLGDVITTISPRKIEDKSAEDFIIESAYCYEGNLTIICFGPLTNLANAIRKDSSIISKISKVVVMGISYDDSLEEPYHEFNLSVDPQAADEVLKAGFNDIDIVTHEAGIEAWIEKEYLDSLLESSNKISRFIGQIANKYMDFSYKHYNINGLTAPDPITCASVIDKNIVNFKPCQITVDLVNRGVSEVKLVLESNIKISTGINLEEFRRLFKKTFK